MANITYSVIEKGCYKLWIGNTFWKRIVIPSLLYGTNIINLIELNKTIWMLNCVLKRFKFKKLIALNFRSNY